MRRTTVIAALICMVLAPLAAAQDAPGPISWIAFDTSKPGKSRDLIGMTIKDDGPMYDELLKKGALNSWGIAIPITHRLDDTWNYVLWADMDGWAQVGELQAGFEKLFASRTPEQMAEMQKAYSEATVEGAHHDWIVRYQVHRVNPSGAVPRYIYVSYYTAKSGGGQALTEIYKSHVAPVYEGLLGDGTITGYGLYTQELHGEQGWTHIGWFTTADLGAVDTVGRTLEESMTQEQMAEAMQVMDWDKHKDQVLLIVHLGGSAQQE